MKAYSNRYIFTFAAIMVIAVATVLSVAAMLLQPLQKKNVEVNKKQNILAALNIASTADDAEDKYDQYIRESYVVDTKGERNPKVEAFKIDMKKELSKPQAEMNLPMFEAEFKGERKYVFTLRGKGLWGPIWGFVALNSDLNTIYGANFDHQGETPGLGAEINTKWFQKQFIGKKIFNEQDEFVSIEVTKGNADPNAPHEVDGVSGGTITSNGLDDMLETGLGYYMSYIQKLKEEGDE
ncbi:MAG: NADH:ubiquinone reductase (Na(+)-transporting) subunit C [Bacteroidales bacterium]